MATLYSTSTKEGVDINNVFVLNTSTPEYPAPPFNPGELCWGTDGSEWVYCQSSITIAPGSVVLLSSVPGQWSASLIGGATVATAPTGTLLGVTGGGTGSVAIPSVTAPAKTNYFWVQRAGNAPNVNAAAASNKNAQLYSSATIAGMASATAGGAGTTYQLNGIWFSQANGSTAGPNTATLNFPVVGIGA